LTLGPAVRDVIQTVEIREVLFSAQPSIPDCAAVVDSAELGDEKALIAPGVIA
jgi:hypothetical protein